MSRHLLPKIKGSLNITIPGEWVDFTDDFSTFQGNIEIPETAQINVTSIPSPWARMILFRDAVRDKGHQLHMEAMSSILDVIEIIFSKKRIGMALETRQIHLQADKAPNRFHEILNKLYPGQESGRADISLTLVLAKQGNETFVLAGSSPHTLFFTPLDLKLKRKIKRYFKEKPVTLAERPPEFQKWFSNVFLPRLRELKAFPSLVNALEAQDGIGAGRNTKLPDNRSFEPSALFGTNDRYHGLFDQTNTLGPDSPILLVTSVEGVENPPIVIDTSQKLKDQTMYEDYTFGKNWTPEDLYNMDREVLPGEVLKYPWILPKYDFLQPCIMRYRYKLNDEFLIMGDKSNEFKYLPPLTEKYFQYFTPEEADKYLSIIYDGPQSVKVRLRIPLQGGILEVERSYRGAWGVSRKEDCIIEFDDLDIGTPLPHLVIWPKLNPANWKYPYYCMIYGERYNGQSEEITSMTFLDSAKKPIPCKTARKSKSVDISELDTLPTYIAVKHNESGCVGFMLLDHKKIPAYTLNITEATVGIDFGTSHTTIAMKINGHTEILQYSAPGSGISLNRENFISAFEFNESQMQSGNIPMLVKNNLSQYLYPNRLGLGNSDEETSFPLPTMVIKAEGPSNPQALLDYSVNFSKSEFFPYAQASVGIGKAVSQMSDLKWNHDLNNQQASEEYLKILINLLRCELIKRRVDPEDASYLWAYPRSFLENDQQKYITMWNKILGAKGRDNTDESKAALMYFDHTRLISAQTPGMVIIADVGGGSSDVSVWRNGNIHLLNSSLWAGRDLVGFKDVNGNHSVIYDTLRKEYKEIADRYLKFDDYQTHLNYILYSLNDGQLSGLSQSSRMYKVRFLIIYFFSSLFYEIGLQCRRFADGNLRSLDVCLAGNGSRFACWSGQGDRINPIDGNIYKSIIRASMGLGGNVEINLQTSSGKKWEVAVGLCEGNQSMLNQQTENGPVIAETSFLSGQKVDSGTGIEDFSARLKPNINDMELRQDESELVKFHDLLFAELSKSDVYTRDMRREPLLCDLTKLKRELLGNWDGLVGLIRAEAGNNLTNFNTISSSLFILGMKAVIKRLHEYLGQGQADDGN